MLAGRGTEAEQKAQWKGNEEARKISRSKKSRIAVWVFESVAQR